MIAHAFDPRQVLNVARILNEFRRENGAPACRQPPERIPFTFRLRHGIRPTQHRRRSRVNLRWWTSAGRTTEINEPGFPYRQASFRLRTGSAFKRLDTVVLSSLPPGVPNFYARHPHRQPVACAPSWTPTPAPSKPEPCRAFLSSPIFRRSFGHPFGGVGTWRVARQLVGAGIGLSWCPWVRRRHVLTAGICIEG